MPLLVYSITTNFTDRQTHSRCVLCLSSQRPCKHALAQAASRAPQQMGHKKRATIQDFRRVALRRNISEGRFGVGINLSCEVSCFLPGASCIEVATCVRNEQPQHRGFPCAACRSNRSYGPLGSNIVAVLDVCDRNLLLKSKTNARNFLHLCCAVTAIARSACSFRRKCFTTCEMPNSCPKKSFATALSISCIDR